MEITVKAKYIRISPKKIRLMADETKHKPVIDMIDVLSLSRTRSAFFLKKVLQSAVASAKDKKINLDKKLIIKSIQIDKATVLKRFRAGARGSARQIKKRNSHIIVTLIRKEDQKQNVQTEIKKSIKKATLQIKNKKDGSKS